MAKTSGDEAGTWLPTRQFRLVKLSSMAGSTVESYDFAVFGSIAALAFSKVFFPSLGPVAGSVASLAIFSSAFLARMVGGVFFGQFGDRLGRRRVLIATLILMGIGTLGVAFLPGAAAIGIMAPVLLLLLRLVQGFSLGGEYAGSILLVVENTAPSKRPAVVAWPLLGGTLGFVVASLVLLVVSLAMSEEAFLAWGWRISLLFGAVLILIGLFIRSRIEETKDFARFVRGEQPFRSPLRAVTRSHFAEIGMGVAMFTTPFAFNYIAASYLIAYARQQLHLEPTTVLIADTCSGVVYVLSVLLGVWVSMRVGVTRALLVFGAAEAVIALTLFPLVDLAPPFTYALGVALALSCSAFAAVPAWIIMIHAFPVGLRYTGSALTYNTAAVAGGAVTPLIAVWLHTAVGSEAIGLYLLLLVCLGTGLGWRLAGRATTA
ncbi:MFS transporter [Streptomyces sp. NPDC127084]|uniref:MFS transporter n=1 Tax=Streptomyces sp. NPDC127084 TaxID=3347133 RepID=UPI003655025B